MTPNPSVISALSTSRPSRKSAASSWSTAPATSVPSVTMPKPTASAASDLAWVRRYALSDRYVIRPPRDVDAELPVLREPDAHLVERDDVPAGVLAVRPELDPLLQQRRLRQAVEFPVGRRQRDVGRLGDLFRGHGFGEDAHDLPAVGVVERVQDGLQIGILVVRERVTDHLADSSLRGG